MKPSPRCRKVFASHLPLFEEDENPWTFLTLIVYNDGGEGMQILLSVFDHPDDVSHHDQYGKSADDASDGGHGIFQKTWKNRGFLKKISGEMKKICEWYTTAKPPR